MSDDELTEVLEQLVVASRTTCTQNQLSEETSSLAEARKVVMQSEQVKDSPSSSSSSINAGSENYETLSKRKDPGNDISEVIISKSKNMQVDKVKGSTTRAESEPNILTKTDQSQDGKEEMGSSNIQLSKRLESVESGMAQTFGIQASHVLLLEKTQKAFKEVITAIEQCLQLILYVVGPICLSTVTVLSLVGWKTLSYKSGGSSTASQSAEGPIFTETTNVSAASKSQLFNSSFQILGHLLQSSFDSLRLFIRKFLQSARKFEIWSILEGSARSLCSFLSTMLFTVNKLVSIFLNQQSESQAFKQEAYDSFSNRISNEDIYLNNRVTASVESSLQTFENAEPAPEIGSLPVNKSKGSSGTHGKFMPSIDYANNSQLQIAFGSQDQELQDLRDCSHELPSTIKGKLDHSYGSGSASTQTASAFVKAIKDPTPYQREKSRVDFTNYPEWAHSHRGRTFEERDSNATERLSKAPNGKSDDAKILKRPLQSRIIWDDSSLLSAIKGMKLQIGDEWKSAEHNVLDSFILETQAKRRAIDNINERQNVVHMHKQNVHAMGADSMQHHPPKPNVSHGLNSKENTSSHPFLRILLANDSFFHKGEIWVRDSDGVFVQQKAEIVKKQKSG